MQGPCWKVEGIAVDVPRAMHTKQASLLSVGANRPVVANDDIPLFQSSPRAWHFLQHHSSSAISSAAVYRNLARPSVDARPTIGQRVLIYDVHTHLNGSQTQAAVHDGRLTRGAGHLSGIVNDLPHAARTMGIIAEALVFLPEALFGDSLGQLPPPVARGLDAIRTQYSRVLICRAAMMGAGASLARAIRDAESPKAITWAAHSSTSGMRGRRYDGVLTWSGFQLPDADELAHYLGVPPSGRYLLRTTEHAAAARGHDGTLHEGQKLQIRMQLNASGAAGNVPTLGFTELEQVESFLSATGGAPVCFPCFMKPSSHAGGSVGAGTYHLWKRPIRSKRQLIETASRLFHHLPPGGVIILEKLLRGPILFAETLVHRGKLLRCSFRALKMASRDSDSIVRRSQPGKVAFDAPPPGVQLWQLPAVLTPEEEHSCTATVNDTVLGLGLNSGVFGLQLVLDAQLGCPLLDINLRPHGWPLLHEATFQAFASDIWSYAQMSLLLATDAPLATVHAAAGIDVEPPPAVLEFACRGHAVLLGEMWYVELLQYFVGNGDCKMDVRSRGAPARPLAPPVVPPLRRLDCDSHHVVAGGTLLRRVKREVVTSDECQSICMLELEFKEQRFAPSRSCTAFVHNAYRECHLLSGRPRTLTLLPDDEKHRSFACILHRKFNRGESGVQGCEESRSFWCVLHRLHRKITADETAGKECGENAAEECHRPGSVGLYRGRRAKESAPSPRSQWEWLRFRPDGDPTLRRALLLPAPNPARAKDLVVLLHGWRANASYFANTGFWGLPALANVNVLCAEGLGGSWMHGWSRVPPHMVTGAGAGENLEVRYLRAAVRKVAAGWPTVRVYLVGKSDGAIMGLIAACALDEISGVVSISGLAPSVLSECSRVAPLNALLVQGMHDTMVPPDGGPMGGNRSFTFYPLAGVTPPFEPYQLAFPLKSARATAMHWAEDVSPCRDCSTSTTVRRLPPFQFAGHQVTVSQALMGPACAFNSTLWRVHDADHFWRRHEAGARLNSALDAAAAMQILDEIRMKTNALSHPTCSEPLRETSPPPIRKYSAAPPSKAHEVITAGQVALTPTFDHAVTAAGVLARLKTKGWAILPQFSTNVVQVDSLMAALCAQMDCRDYWPTYMNSTTADRGRRSRSQWLHSVTERGSPMDSLAPHNEHAYSGCTPSVVVFHGASAGYRGGHTVLFENLEADHAANGEAIVQFERGRWEWRSTLTVRSAFNGARYVALPAVDVWAHSIYTEHFVWQMRHLLPYNWSSIVRTALKRGGGAVTAGRQLLDRYYFATVQARRALPMQLTAGDVLILDNRRWTHSVLASQGERVNSIGMLVGAGEQCRPAVEERVGLRTRIGA